MQALSLILSLFVAGLGQFLNRYKGNPTLVIKGATVIVGCVLYGLGNGWPAQWSGPAFAAWVDPAVAWGFGVLGISSLAAAHPSLATDSK